VSTVDAKEIAIADASKKSQIFSSQALAVDKKVAKNVDMDTKKLRLELGRAIDQLIKVRIELDGGSVIPPRSLDLVKQGICLACEQPIEHGRPIRGCHESCKKTVLLKIESGEYTELEAIQRGLILPAESGGRKPRSFEKEKPPSHLRAAESPGKYVNKKTKT
jgi:hypothetical protein